jgi:hypothetical protein
VRANSSQAGGRTRQGTRFALNVDAMPGPKVTATTTYCGHTLRAEVELNRQRDWIGRCVVTGPAFNGAVRLYAPLRTPREALDALLTEVRWWIDEERGAGSPRSPHAEAANASTGTPETEHLHDD